jgi:copper chaperone CopZ
LKKLNFLIVLTLALSIVAVSGTVIAEKKDATVLKRTVLKVDNLSSGGCFATISQSLTPMEGFSGFGANLLRNLVAVDFVPPLTPEVIVKTITESGYPAQLESTNDITEKESFAYIQQKRNLYSGSSGQGKGSCCSVSSVSSSAPTPAVDTSKNRTSYNSGGGSCCQNN